MADQNLIDIGKAAAAQYGIPWDVFYNQIAGESDWNPKVGTSSAGAQGLAQFIPSTAAQYGVDVNDPVSSLHGAARYMSDLYKQSGSWSGALTGYLTGRTSGSPPRDVLSSNAAYRKAYEAAGYDVGGTSAYELGYKPGEKLPSGAMALGGIIRPRHDDENIAGIALLNSIMQQRYAGLEQADTGNGLLNSIIKGATEGTLKPPEAPKPQAQLRTEDIPRAAPPQTVPELLPGTAAEIPAMQPLPTLPAAQPAKEVMPAAIQPSEIAPPPTAPQETAGAAQPTPAPFPTVPPPQPQPQKPVIQPTPQRVEAGMLGDTGNALLNKILSGGPSFLTAPRGGASLIGSLLSAPSRLEAIPQAIEANVRRGLDRLGAGEQPPGAPPITTPGGFRAAALDPSRLETATNIALSTGPGSLAGSIKSYLPIRSAELKAQIGEAKALDDDLFKLQQQNQAKMIETRQRLEQLSQEILDPNVQERAYHERESRMTGAPTQPSPATRQIEQALQPLDEQILADATWIRENAPDAAKALPELATAEEGYVHRKVLGRPGPGERLDPVAREPITGAGRSLGRRASSLERRTPYYVIEDNAGKRLWGRGLIGSKGAPARYGETFTDARTGKRYTVKPPTTAEIEAHTPTRYSKNLLANTVDNALRLDRVRRNIELLNKWKPRLEAKGMWSSETSNLPPGFDHVDIPQLRGSAPRHIASVLNDFYRTSPSGFLGFLDRANKFLIGSMFVLPVRHQLNVGAHYVVGRGFDNLYSNPQLARATREVASQGPEYLRLLKAGAGLRYPSTLNENFYNTMLEKLFHDQMRDPEWKGIAKELGVKVSDLVKAEYAWSRRALWKWNDVFLTARIFELEGQGMPMDKAIQQAEKEIPNYRIPPEVMKSQTMADFLKSPVIAFGRYGYGRAKAISEMIKDMVGRQAAGSERVRALGQATALVALGTGGYSIANAALNFALQQTGLRKPTDRPMSLVGAGPFGIMHTGMALAGLRPEHKDLAAMLGTLITPAPTPLLLEETLGGMRDIFSGHQFYNRRGSAASQAGDIAKSLGMETFPGEVIRNVGRKGMIGGFGPMIGIQEEPR